MNISLYIGNKLVDIQKETDILYNYQTDELNNPTIVKNSFSKTITLQGTPQNNKIFGEYWNLERWQMEDDFNASKKVDFQLYVGADIYESGYVKLDNVKKDNGIWYYDITLYGGLGDFFYNLSTTDDGNQMKLSDLEYDYDLDFTINRQTVKAAWDALESGTEGKWQTINFMTAYNGKPDDFDADKCIINIDATPLQKEKDGYKPKNGWVIAELPQEMTEWETRDFRSYLQRPCIRMKKIVEACCNPDVNGGYVVDLDKDFFNEDNPYWEKTWLTLPMIQNLEYTNGEQILENAELISGDNEGETTGYMYEDLVFNMGEFGTSIPSSINVKSRIKIDTVGGCGKTTFLWFWRSKGNDTHNRWDCGGALFAQLLAFNGDNVIGASDAYCMTTPVRHNGRLYYYDNSDFSGSRKFTPYMGKSIRTVLGDFEGSYFRGENKTNYYDFDFTINNINTNVTGLKLCYFWGATSDKCKRKGQNVLFNYEQDSGWTGNNEGGGTYAVPVENINAEIVSTNLKAAMGSSIGRSETKVTKGLILNTEASPCDYLLSYCKMFGLYFAKDINEPIIRIQTRKSFYDRSEVLDLSEMIDKSKDYQITPIAFDTKWVQFSQETEETVFSNKYKSTRGIDYGCKVLNTGYEFNSEKKQLLEDNVIKSGIEGLEKSQYFTCYNNDRTVRPWFGYGLKYNLYKGSDTIEVYGSNSSGSDLLGLNEGNNMKYYDVFPKMQFRDEENNPTDGNNVLVFFSGMKNVTTNRANPLWCWLTDDNQFQTLFNEAKPCWLFTTSQLVWDGKKYVDVALKLDKLPVFERYLTSENGLDVKKSLDFGSPQELYVPTYRLTEDVNIYSNFWKTYLEDLYDINTRILTCYVRINNRPSIEWLRKFYWFDNTIWRINKIIDWKIGSEETTKVEFIKVQDMDSYTSVSQDKETNKPSLGFEFDKNKIDFGGGDVIIKIDIPKGEDWVIFSDDDVIFTKGGGEGPQTITATIPQNPTPTETKTYYITATTTDGQIVTQTIVQGYPNETEVKTDKDYILIPYDGGEYNVAIDWKNQGENEIKDYSTDLDVDITLNPYDMNISMGLNETQGVKSGSIVLEGDGYSTEIVVEQLPKTVEFAKEGGEFDLDLSGDIEFVEYPYWITVNGNSLVAEPNYYPSERSGRVVISDGQNKAVLTVVQYVGELPIREKRDVSPMNLYYGVEGGDQFLLLNIPTSWNIKESLEWVELNVRNGDEEGVVRVRVSENEGDTRQGVLVVEDIENSELFNIHISQIGPYSEPTFRVLTEEFTAPSQGGTYTIEVEYVNRNGDYVDVETELQHTNLKWVGDIATMEVIVPQNKTLNLKQHRIVFSNVYGEFYFTIWQDEFVEVLTLGDTTINVPYNATKRSVEISSNVDWYATEEYDWFNTNSLSGKEGTNTMVININENETLNEREGKINIFSINDTLLGTITIIQGGFNEVLSVEPNDIVVDYEANTITLNITSNSDWIILEND